MKPIILIAGGSGLIGSRLVEYLSDEYEFYILSRSKKENKPGVKYFVWNTDKGEMDLEAFKDVTAVINLAGAGIADKRWTAHRKKQLVSSRVDSVATLLRAMEEAGMKRPLYIGASAIGYYGDTGSTKVIESDKGGTGFLAKVTQEWEEAHERIYPYFDRSVLLRIGIVLSKKGGALKEMIKPANLGVYGYFGNGSAYYSWIHVDDICKMIASALKEESYSGVYNATAPEPITIKELIVALKKAKGAIGIVLPVPELALKLVLGEMTQMLTDSMRVLPQRMLSEGYNFIHDEPIAAIKDILEKKI